MDDMNINKNAQRIKDRDPISNIVPKKDTSEFTLTKVEREKAKTAPKPETKSADLGKTILPSNNLAKPQNTRDKTSPTTKSAPFETSIGIFENGKKKRGNNIITKKSERNESLSNIIDRIV
jgi:hypothetical protein